MNLARETVDVLKVAVAKLEAIERRKLEPVLTTIGLEEAVERIQSVVGHEHFSIELECRFWGDTEVWWKIWHGQEYRRAHTLQDAVNILLASLAPQSENAILEAQVALPVPAGVDPRTLLED